MKRFYIPIFMIILTLFGCKKFEKEERVTSKPVPAIVRDTELEKWREEIRKEVYTIDLTQLSNPFITPKTYKLLAKKEEVIPLELVGVLNKGGKKYALLQDPTKKGYIVKMGDRIGKSKIIEISSDYIIIEEIEENIFGEVMRKKRKISLKRSEP